MTASPPQRARSEEAAIFIGALLLYLLLPSRNPNYADDSMRWAAALVRDTGLISSHHLFLNGVRWCFHLLERLSGSSLDPARTLALYNSLWGAVGLAALHRLLIVLDLAEVALPGALLCGFTAGYWAYSIVGDVYVPAIALTVIGIAAFLAGITAPDGRRRALLGATATGAFVLAIAHHQSHFLIVAGTCLGGLLILPPRTIKRVRYSLGVLGLTGLIALAGYGAAYRLSYGREGPGFRKFLLGYAESFDPQPDQKRVTAGTIANAGMGEVRAIFATNVVFRSERLTRAVQNRFPYRNLYPYPYLVRRLGKAALAIILLGMSAAAACSAWLLLLGLGRAFRENGPLRVLVLAGLPQAVFFIWWEAISDEFWLWSLPLLAVVIAAGAWGSVGRKRMLWVAVGGLGISTLLGAVLLFADPGNDIDTVNGRFLAEVRGRDLLLGWDGIQSCGRVALAQPRQGFRWFNVFARGFHWAPGDSAELDRTIESTLAAGGRVFVHPYLAHPPISNMVLIGLHNPRFESERQAILARLRAIDPGRISWEPLAASVPGYFR
ncbi:MAG TPA: hypothetical protein VGK89_08730 [Candidatus Eisenbacteria bacterium]|jgi:hypothetical protein